jgi:hypothetical protein
MQTDYYPIILNPSKQRRITMTLFQCIKKTGKVVANSFVSVLGSDGGTFLIEDQSTRKACNVPKTVFNQNFARIC